MEEVKKQEASESVGENIKDRTEEAGMKERGIKGVGPQGK